MTQEFEAIEFPAELHGQGGLTYERTDVAVLRRRCRRERDVVEAVFAGRLPPAFHQLAAALTAPDTLTQERLSFWQHFNGFES